MVVVNLPVLKIALHGRGESGYFTNLFLEIRLGLYICSLNTDLTRIYGQLSFAQRHRSQHSFLLLISIPMIANSTVAAYELLTSVSYVSLG